MSKNKLVIFFLGVPQQFVHEILLDFSETHFVPSPHITAVVLMWN